MGLSQSPAPDWGVTRGTQWVAWDQRLITGHAPLFRLARGQLLLQLQSRPHPTGHHQRYQGR